MNIKELQYFDYLVEKKNFSQVAEHFGVSQPTITMAIKRLEEEYDTTFFIRDQSHHSLVVTKTGRLFHDHVQTILNELDVARKEIDRTHNEKILFGMPPIIGNYFFPDIAPQLARHNMLQKLDVFDEGSAELLKMLKAGDIDFALLASLQPLNLTWIKAEVLARTPISIFVSPDHPLAKKQAEGVHFADLKPYHFISFDEGFIHQQAFREMSRVNHFRPKIYYRTGDVHVLKALVAEGLGISYVTPLAVSEADGLVEVPLLDNNLPEFVISKAVRQSTSFTPTMAEFWDLLTKDAN